MSALALQTPTFSSGVRMVPVRSDNMEPGLRRERDWVVMLPCDDYVHDGIYVLDRDGFGVGVRRVQCRGRGEVELISDNPAYRATQVVPRDYFKSVCLGIVVGRLLIDEIETLQAAGLMVS